MTPMEARECLRFVKDLWPKFLPSGANPITRDDSPAEADRKREVAARQSEKFLRRLQRIENVGREQWEAALDQLAFASEDKYKNAPLEREIVRVITECDPAHRNRGARLQHGEPAHDTRNDDAAYCGAVRSWCRSLTDEQAAEMQAGYDRDAAMPVIGEGVAKGKFACAVPTPIGDGWRESVKRRTAVFEWNEWRARAVKETSDAE